MHDHRYNTRSKVPGSGPEPSGSSDPSQKTTKKTSQLPATKQPDPQKRATRPKFQATSSVSALTAPVPGEATPRLFTLPDELQTIIYKHLVLEPLCIWIRVFLASRTEKTDCWKIRTAVQQRHKDKPALLSVCKYLRSFASPIYLAGNTFAVVSTDWKPQNIEMLRKMWGECVKHIRSIEYMITVSVRFVDRENFPPPGRNKSEYVGVGINIKLLQSGTLVFKVSSSGSRESENLPSGEICHCALDRIALTLRNEATDDRRLFEMMAECKKYHRATASGGECSRCSLPALTNIDLRR
ncbi:hypothetical protein M409DRAFT_52996 [Zasmidium cellare ATCC 36951]|uniref:F-box domain-containing protein n=1 Tax=Zasmidium cellare ATCC 36951 TaxID=1080233 RepID=A0A6A6CPJ5_ZASCE|nr:uncharacterized protein M409DRAFT_52996 [Zasmidium cellare ATCC 36951]KAF2169025.1 hypothetical protein M409DRAFT_52996 [Zasmidium cellare ATCC 36951]